MTRIPFIGPGNMGLPMAPNLATAGHAVVGLTLPPPPERPPPRAATLAEPEAGAGAANTVLAYGAAVQAVWGPLADLLPAGAPLVDCSTNDVASSLKVHATAAARGLQTLDAPDCSGSRAPRRRA